MRTTLNLALALLFIGSTGCEQFKAGKSGNLEIGYVKADDEWLPVSSNRKIAGDLDAKLQVRDADTDEEVSITDASSADRSVLDVASTSGNIVVVTGGAAGTAELTVDSDRGSDSWDLEVGEIAIADLSYPHGKTEAVAALVGGEVSLPMSLKDADNKGFFGFGALPVVLAPAASATQIVGDNTGFANIGFDAPGAVTITGTGDDDLVVTGIEEADLASLELTNFLGGSLQQLTAQVDSFTVLAVSGLSTAGDTVFGVDELATVTTSTPTICSVAPAPQFGEGAQSVAGLAVGDCVIEATLGALPPVSVTVTVSAAPQ